MRGRRLPTARRMNRASRALNVRNVPLPPSIATCHCGLEAQARDVPGNVMSHPSSAASFLGCHKRTAGSRIAFRDDMRQSR